MNDQCIGESPGQRRPGRSRAVFRPFFLLAALDGLLAMAVWLPGAILPALASPSHGWAPSPVLWHKAFVLFGTAPVVLAGFLLTALPRWTGKPPISAAMIAALLLLWGAGRGTFILLSMRLGLAFFAIFVSVLLLAVFFPILRGRSQREWKVVALLAAFWFSAVVASAAEPPGWVDRLALASLLGLLMVIGGRVIPALGMSYWARRGGGVYFHNSMMIDALCAASSTISLLFWVNGHVNALVPIAHICAAMTNLLRFLQWKTSLFFKVPSLMALHSGYAWIIFGFFLLLGHGIAPAQIDDGAAFHAWSVGALGLMMLGMMASMIRKHSGHSFQNSSAATASFVAMALCAGIRVFAAWPSAFSGGLHGAAALLWIGAFGCFLGAFGRFLVWGR